MSKKTSEFPPQVPEPATRRLFVGALAATLGSIPLMACIPSAMAQAKVAKEKAKYRNTPNGEEQCSKCQFFLAEEGKCRTVEGDISPSGWCVLFARKT